MITVRTELPGKSLPAQKKFTTHGWQRIILLVVLGYEAAGCFLGGTLLILEPDGRLMNMPVQIMHGFFTDFLIPGIILFALGVLNLITFISVLRKAASDWWFSSLALGGLYIWFVVEIIILRELHWLHLMWGVPVLLGLVMAMPLIIARNESATTGRILLLFGIFSSVWYLAINIFVPIMYPGYSIVSVTVSELSAINAPTRILWVLLVLPYPLFFALFGWGVLRISSGSRTLKIMGSLIIADSTFNLYWPAMHQRQIIALGNGSLTDSLHIVWAMVTLIFMLLIIIFGAAALGKRFRIYSIATLAIFIVFGTLTWLESPGISQNLPTPYIGLWERINIGAFLLWVAVFAVVLIRREKSKPA
jgi:hypothetical protein